MTKESMVLALAGLAIAGAIFLYGTGNEDGAGQMIALAVMLAGGFAGGAALAAKVAKSSDDGG